MQRLALSLLLITVAVPADATSARNVTMEFRGHGLQINEIFIFDASTLRALPTNEIEAYAARRIRANGLPSADAATLHMHIRIDRKKFAECGEAAVVHMTLDVRYDVHSVWLRDEVELIDAAKIDETVRSLARDAIDSLIDDYAYSIGRDEVKDREAH